MASREEVRRVSIFINGTQADLTLSQLEKGSQKLKNELRRLVPGTEEFKRKLEELRQTRSVLKGVENDIKGIGGAFGWLKTEIGKLGVLATGFLGLQFVTDQFKNIISQNAKLADSISDIQKTTSMSELSVRRMQKEFKELDTRTSRAELNSLAEVAGKLGISGEKDVIGFVKAADQINVALGKDLGNAEQAINDLGKLTEIFKIKEAFGLEQALLKTGSAINDLGAAGTANEGYIVEFTKRMGGIAPQAKISIQDILGLAATMDELGQPAEAASTAIGQFVMGLGKDVPKYASIAKMSVKQFTDLLQKDGNQALIAVLKNLKSSGEGIASMAESMGMVGDEGARATAALGLLSNNMELLKVRQQQSNESFAKGTSLTNEYNIKNNNFAATLDRLGKKFAALTANASLTDFLTGGVKALDSFMTGLNKCMGFITGMIKMLTLGGVAWLTYSTYVAIAKSQTLAFMVNLVAGDAVMKMSRITTIALAGAKALLSRDLAKATQAMRLFSVATEANPIGALVAAIMAAVTAFAIYGDTVTTAVRIENSIIDVNAQAEKSYLREKTALESAMATLNKRNKTKLEEAAAIAKLRDIMPDHLKGYTDEEIAAGKATEAINKQIDAIMRKARASAASKRIEELEGENIDIGTKAKKGWNGLSNWEKMTTGLAMTAQHGALTNAGVKEAWFKELRQKQLDNQQEIRELMSSYGKDINYTEPVRPNLGTGDGGPGVFNLKEATQAQLEEQLQKDTKALAQLKRGTEEYNKVAAEMVAIRKRLKEIGKDTGVGGAGEDPVKKAKSAFQQLQKEVKALSGKALDETLNQNEKEIKASEDKYNQLIDKEKDFLKKKGVTAEQARITRENITKLEEQRDAASLDIRTRQEREMVDKVISLRNALANAHESELQKETARINAFYDDLQSKTTDMVQWEYLEENRAIEIADAKIREEKRLQDAVTELKQQGIVTASEKDKIELARINKKYDDQIEALKQRFSKELQLTKAFQDAIAIIEKNRTDETNQYEANKKKELNQAITEAVVNTAKEISDAFFEVGANNRRAETDSQLAALDKKKEKELQNKNLTETQKAAIEQKYDRQAAAIKLKAWKADQAAKRTQALINGALAVTMALASSPWPFNLINAAAVAAATAVQVVKIGKEKPPQFEEGGFSAVDYKKPQGWVRSPTLFKNSRSGRDFTAGEKFKTEYIISSEQLKDPVISNFVGAMEANRGVRRFEAGGFSNATTKIAQPVTVSTNPAPAPPVDLTPLLEEMQQTRMAMANMKLSWSWQLYNKNQTKINNIIRDSNA